MALVLLSSGCGGAHTSSSESQAVDPTSSGGPSSGTSPAVSAAGNGITLLGDGGRTESSDDEAGTGNPFAEGGAGVATLNVTIRDFQMFSKGGENPDFQNETGDDRGLVEMALGADQKPVYAKGAGPTRTTHGQTFFDQWYNDKPGVNIDVQYPITLSSLGNGLYGYDSLISGVTTDPVNDKAKGWFPIDDGTPYATSFGNQGELHNYSFTTELHTIFTYSGGETFTFSGDDDVFVFIARSLVIDLGGVHSREVATVSVDALGLTVGQTYPLDLFSAERHTVESNFSFSTTLALEPAPVTPR